MQGHAGANLMPLVAANRVGHEVGTDDCEITFYGSSFIADTTGAKVAEAGRDGEAVLIATFDRELLRSQRARVGAVPRSPPRPVRPDCSPSTAATPGRQPQQCGRRDADDSNAGGVRRRTSAR